MYKSPKSPNHDISTLFFCPMMTCITDVQPQHKKGKPTHEMYIKKFRR